MKRCVIVGGADINHYRRIKNKMTNNDFVIYCDSGLRHRRKLGKEPNLIVGDFDSYDDPKLPVETITLPTVKDDTDTVYAVKTTGRRYAGKVGLDYYGRPSPQHAHGTGNLDRWTNSTRRIRKAILEIFDRTVDPDLLIRRVNIAAAVLPEKDAPREGPEQLDLFTDYEALEKQRAEEQAADEKERRMQQTTLLIQQKYGKNAVLKGMNFLEGGTTIERNAQIGGHRSGE